MFRWFILYLLFFNYEIFLLHAQPLTSSEYLTKPARVVGWQVNVEGKTTVPDAQAASDKNKTYKYFDGFGRPLQDIIRGLHS